MEASDRRNYLMGYRYPVSNTYVLVTRAFPRLSILAVHGNRVSYVRTIKCTLDKAWVKWEKSLHLRKTRRKGKS